MGPSAGIRRLALPVLVMLLLSVSMSGPTAAQGARGASPGAPPASDPSLLDLGHASIVTPANLSLQERTAVRVLVEEIEKRTTIRLSVSSQWPAGTVTAIAVGPLATSSS